MIHLTILLGLSASMAASDAAIAADEMEIRFPAEEFFVVERPPGEMPIAVPRDEALRYKVLLDIGVLGTAAGGEVSMTSGVDHVAAGLPRPGEEPVMHEVPWIRTHATGSHFGYRVDHELRVRLLPHQEWPRTDYRDTQAGSESKRRILKVGTRDGESVSSYVYNKHCLGCERKEHWVKGRFFWESDGHCGGCRRASHRVFRDEPAFRSVPADAVDMLSAVFLARAMVRAGIDETQFHLIDQKNLWEVTLHTKGHSTIEVAAGTFDVTEIVLEPGRPAGEDFDDDEPFEGLFGIHGSIQIFFDRVGGVPILIKGDVPVGPFTIGVRCELQSWRGIPPGFAAAADAVEESK